MILLDTNVVAEVMKTQPAEAVVAWLNGQDSERICISAVTIGQEEAG